MNFTKAALELYTTQPTISKSIYLLEKELGFKLFERNSKMMRLTPCGKVILEEFKKAIDIMETAISKAKKENDSKLGHINIGFPISFNIKDILSDLFKQFYIQSPNITVKFFIFSFIDLRKRLLNGDLDIIVTLSFEKISDEPKYVNYLPISRSKPRIYFNKQYLSLPNDNDITINDLNNLPIILLDDHASISGYEYVYKIAYKYGISTSDVIMANNLETMFLYIESGAGIAILGSSFNISKNKKISYLELDDFNEQVGTNMLWISKNSNPSVEIFIDYLAKFLNSPIQNI